MMRNRATAILVMLVLVGAGCAGNEPSATNTGASEDQVAELTTERETLKQQVVDLTMERDALADQIAVAEARHATAEAAEKLLTEIIDDPGAYGTQDEVLDALAALAVPGTVMDDTVFGAVPFRSAWSGTLYGGLDAEIKTWKRWLSDDGSQGASLWTWIGTAPNGEPFELIGINVTDYDEEGMITNILVDWPYEPEYVRNAVANGTGVDATAEGIASPEDRTGSLGMELPAAAAETLENYTTALTAADGEAMLNYVTDDFAFLSYGDVQEREFRADYVTKHYANFSVEGVGDRMVLGGGDTYIVSEPERATKPALVVGFSTYRLIRSDGEWLVDTHRFTGE